MARWSLRGRRLRHPGRRQGRADPYLPALDVAQARLVRVLVRQAFAERGVEVAVYGASVVDDAGHRYGLGDLARECRATVRRRHLWPRLVRGQVEAFLSAVSRPAPVDTVPVDQLLTSVYLRVVGSRMVAADVGFGYTQRLAGDLVEVIAVDEPDRVVNLDDAQVERIGEDRLRGAALENLFTEPLERHRTLPLPRGGNVHVVTGESFFVASKVLVLADVVRRLCDSPDMRYGALVGMPGRHYLMFHVIHDMNVLDAINMMTGMIARGYLRYPGPVSPYLYWWKAGTLTQLSFVEDDGSFRIEVRDTFAEVLNALAAEMG